MESEDLKKLLTFLTNIYHNNDFGKDAPKIQYFYTELENITHRLPTSDKLDELQKIEIYLETTYDEFNELSYYFNPIYIKIKNRIHNEYVKKIREKNKKKRGIN